MNLKKALFGELEKGTTCAADIDNPYYADKPNLRNWLGGNTNDGSSWKLEKYDTSTACRILDHYCETIPAEAPMIVIE